METAERGRTPTDQPRRVLWCIKGLGAGGAEQLLVSSAQSATPGVASYRVAYLLPWKNALVAPLEAAGVTTTNLGARSSWDPRWVVRLRRELRAHPADVIHAHSPLVAAGARVVARTLPRAERPAVITTEHNVWSSHQRLTRLVNASTVGLDDVTVAVSGAVRDSMSPRARRRTRVVRYGVDTEAVLAAAAGARDAVRAELGIAPDEIVVGTVANIRRTKAYPDLLAAARAVVDEVAGVRFVAVGQGPLEAEARARHAALDLGDRFVFTGQRDDAVRVMAAFDVFCLASHHEGLPIAMMEALTLGLPVVATDVGGIRDLLGDGDDAVLVPAARPDLLAKAIVGVVTDDALRAAMARAAVARRPDLGVAHAVHEMEQIYVDASRR